MKKNKIWESNIQALNERPAGTTFIEPWLQSPPQLPEGVVLTQTTNRLWTARLLMPGGAAISLHSEVDPIAEAGLFIDKHLIERPEMVVVAGVGLGYAALACAGRISSDVPLVVISGEPVLFWLSMNLIDWRSVLTRPNTYLLVGSDPVRMRDNWHKIREKYRGRDVNFVKHPLFWQLRNDLYREITEKKAAGPWWDYPRFQNDEVKVLLVSLKHLLMSEINGALEKLGHRCRVLRIEKEELDRSSVERMFTETIKSFQPDFVLTIDHLGFDQEGVVTDLLTRCRIPFASWYVDSPYMIIRHYAENRSPYLTLFLWDEDYIEITKNLGFEMVEYLPLGVDETLFRPLGAGHNPLSHLASDVSFVGNSMVVKVRSILNRCGINGPLREHFEEVSREFEHSHHLVVRDMLADKFPDLFDELIKLPEPRALGYEWGVTWQATGWYRVELVKKLQPFRPLIVGDPGWKEILDGNFRLHKELYYYADLTAFYNVTNVSFNATSRQMKEGVNQRVFDVPACRAVVLTDWSRQLEGLMEPGREVLAYRSGDEIPELTDRAVRDRKFREKIAEAGYRRVLNEHTYRHRLKKLISVMKRNYG